jgi:proliferating cell nuclear antigen PCNA
MTLEIKVTELDLFTKVLNATATVLEDEGTFVITPDGGITLRNMDKPRFAMVDLKIAPKYFDGNFKCDKEYKISIQMQDLKKILQRGGREDTLTITLKEDKNLLVFTFEGRVKRQFILPLSEPDETTLPDPSKLEYAVKSMLFGGSLTDFIKDASIIGGSINLYAEANKMIFSSSQDNREVKIEINTETENSAAKSIEAESPQEALYSIDSFKNLILVDNAFLEVSLTFSSARPLHLLYVNDTGIELGYLLAPMQPDIDDSMDSEAEAEDDDDDSYDDDDEYDDEEND